jgi:hypothetical protein
MVASGTVLAQEVTPPWAPEPPFSPSNDSIDNDLDSTLEREFTDDRGETIPDYAGESADKDGDKGSAWGVRLRLMGAYWRANIHDLRLSYREGTSGGQTIIFNDDDDDDNNNNEDDPIGDADGGSYRLSLDLGRFVTLSTSLTHARFKDSNLLAPGSGFTFGETTWNTGDLLGSEFEYWSSDLDVALNALNNDYVTLSVGVGLRYTRFETTFSRADVVAENKTLEAVIPAISLGLALRPVKQLEFFAKARIGHLSYEVDDHWSRDSDNEWDYEDSVERESTTVEVDLGISFTIADTIGFIVGYRFDHFEIERLTAERDQSVEGTAHGLYGGLLLSF